MYCVQGYFFAKWGVASIIRIIKKINTSAVLALDSAGREVIVLGKGLGFPATPYELEDLSRIDRTFYNVDPRYLGMITEIPQPILLASAEIAELAEDELDCRLNPNLPFTLADHLHFAVSAAVMVPVQKFFGKHSPDAIRSITEPFFTMLVMIPVSLCVLGPAGAFLGTYVSNAIIWLYNTVGFLGVAVFAGLCPLLVMTGMHSALMPYLMNSLATLGWEPIVLTGMIISNIDQGAACLAVALKTKSADLRSTAIGCGVTAVVGGVTEPGMYGVNLPLKTPLYCAMIGTAAGGLVAGIGKAVAYSITGSAGILGGLPVYLGGGLSNVLWMVGGIAVGFIATFVLTFIAYKDASAR